MDIEKWEGEDLPPKHPEVRQVLVFRPYYTIFHTGASMAFPSHHFPPPLIVKHR